MGGDGGSAVVRRQGRPAAVDADTLAVALDRLRRGESITKIAAHLGVGRSTLYRSLSSRLDDVPEHPEA